MLLIKFFPFDPKINTMPETNLFVFLCLHLLCWFGVVWAKILLLAMMQEDGMVVVSGGFVDGDLVADSLLDAPSGSSLIPVAVFVPPSRLPAVITGL